MHFYAVSGQSILIPENLKDPLYLHECNWISGMDEALQNQKLFIRVSDRRELPHPNSSMVRQIKELRIEIVFE